MGRPCDDLNAIQYDAKSVQRRDSVPLAGLTTDPDSDPDSHDCRDADHSGQRYDPPQHLVGAGRILVRLEEQQEAADAERAERPADVKDGHPEDDVELARLFEGLRGRRTVSPTHSAHFIVHYSHLRDGLDLFIIRLLLFR